jgi:hypothetical protein
VVLLNVPSKLLDGVSAKMIELVAPGATDPIEHSQWEYHSEKSANPKQTTLL